MNVASNITVIGKSCLIAFEDGSITDSAGSISFGTNNLSTTGTFNAGNSVVGNISTGNINTTGTTNISTTLQRELVLLHFQYNIDSGTITSSSDNGKFQ